MKIRHRKIHRRTMLLGLRVTEPEYAQALRNVEAMETTISQAIRTRILDLLKGEAK